MDNICVYYIKSCLLFNIFLPSFMRSSPHGDAASCTHYPPMHTSRINTKFDGEEGEEHVAALQRWREDSPPPPPSQNGDKNGSQ